MLNVVHLRNQFPSGLTAHARPRATGLRHRRPAALGEGHLDVPVDGELGLAPSAPSARFSSGGRLRDRAGRRGDAGRARPAPARRRTRRSPPRRPRSPRVPLGLHRAGPAPIACLRRPGRWNLATRDAFGAFVGAYGEVMKSNRVEADCKTLALFFMDQFARSTRGTPGCAADARRRRRVAPRLSWTSITARNTGYSRRWRPRFCPGVRGGEAHREGRPDALDDLRRQRRRRRGITCATVGQRATVEAWRPTTGATARRRRCRSRRPRRVADLHEPRRRQRLGPRDHRRPRRAPGDKTKVVLAVGSFDDVKDADDDARAGPLLTSTTTREEVTVVLERGFASPRTAARRPGRRSPGTLPRGSTRPSTPLDGRAPALAARRRALGRRARTRSAPA